LYIAVIHYQIVRFVLAMCVDEGLETLIGRPVSVCL
jgi:hypothetical protein